MPIYIHTNQQTSGPFEESAVVAWLQKGQISPDVLACPQGATEWQPLRNLFPPTGQPSAFAGAQATGASPMLDRQAVVNWARQSFPARVEVKFKFGADHGIARNSFVKALDADGVETLGGMRHVWETLQHISYRDERTFSVNPVAALTRALLYSGLKRLTLKLTFQTGEAIIPAFIQNQKELLSLFETIPVERRKF